MNKDIKRSSELQASAVVETYGSNAEMGLSMTAVSSLQAQYGLNKLDEGEKV